MRRQATIILIFTSCILYAHEDHYESIELSNVHINVCDQYESSIEIQLVSSYSSIINEFIRSIDSTEKVFIQYDVDYCYFNQYYYHLFYTNFFDAILPDSYKHEHGFIKNENGLVINFSVRHFKLKPILKLIEFGLNNSDLVIENHKEMLSKFKDAAFDSIMSERTIFTEGKLKRYLCTGLTDSIISSSENSDNICQSLHSQVKFIHNPKSLEEIGIKIFLKDDSIIFTCKDSEILLSTPSLYSYVVIDDTRVFIFDTNSSFKFLSINAPSKSTRHSLPFGVGCLGGFKVLTQEDSKIFQISGYDSYILDEQRTQKKVYYNSISDSFVDM